MPRRTSTRFVTVSKQEFESWLSALPNLTWNEIEDGRAQEHIYNVTQMSGDARALVSVRVYSSVDKRTGVTRDRGTDAIRIVYWDNVNDMPIGAGRKLLRTVSARSTIQSRLRRRIQNFFERIADVRPTDFGYVQHVLERFIEYARPSRRNFPQSLLQQLMDRGTLSSKQVAYVLGEENPRGYPTFEQTLNNQGEAPTVSYQRMQQGERAEDVDVTQEVEANVTAPIRPLTGNEEETLDSSPAAEAAIRAHARRIDEELERRLFDPNEAPNIMPPRRSRTRERIDASMEHARRQRQEGLLNVDVTEESERMVDDLDKFLRRIDGPEVIAGDDQTELVPTAVVEEEYGIYYPFEYFNIVQSMVYRETLETDTNVVIGANTSAGKTVCAELLAHKALAEGKRIAYLSPLKSLTQEKYTDWRNLWPEKNICILTGDYVLSETRKRELAEADIIVMTSEMCDSRTRRMRREGNQWLYEVGLLVVDEAHILTTDRGHAVESGVMRFTKLNPQARVLLLSATMPNVRQLGAWLTNLNDKESKVVSSDWRPVPLELNYPEYEVAYREAGGPDYYATQQNKMQLAVDIMRSRGKEDQKFLVFVHDKATGRKLIRLLARHEETAVFHNADLDLDDRLAIEQKFTSRRRGSLRILVSTSTLAWGRNLPARNVIIVGRHRGINEVDPLDMIQMAGRAGRYGIDEEGTVYVLTEQGNMARQMHEMTNPRDITSVLAKKETLAFHMLAEMQNGVIFDIRTFKEWFNRSFAAITSPLDDSLVTEVFNDMKRLNMIRLPHHGSGRGHVCTNLGNISGWLYFSPYDIAAWHENFQAYFTRPSDSDPLCLAWAFAHIPSFDLGYCPKDLDGTYRRMQAELAATARHLEIGNTAAVAGAFAAVTATDPPSGAAAQAKRALLYDLNRMLHAIRLIDKKEAQWGADWKVISARMKYGIGPELVPLVTIPGVGGKRAKKLFDKGIKTPKQVASPTGKRKMLRIFTPAVVRKIHLAAKKLIREEEENDSR